MRRKNVELTIASLRRNSTVRQQLEAQKKIKIVGSMYLLSGGRVAFFEA